MGQQISQLEHGDLDGAEKPHPGSQSPSDTSRGGDIKPDVDSDDDNSAQPYPDHNTSSQGFAFSSQLPLLAASDTPAYKTKQRKHPSIFERSSESPEPTDMKRDPEEDDIGHDDDAPTPKPAKKKRRRSRSRNSKSKKNQDSTLESEGQEEEAIGDTVTPTKAASHALAMPTSEPKSSMDLDGISSSPAIGQASNGDMDEDESTIDATQTADSEEHRRQEKKERKERRKAKKAAKQAEQVRASLLVANPSFGEHDEPEGLIQGRLAPAQSDDGPNGDFEMRMSNGVSHVDGLRSKESSQVNTATEAFHTDRADHDDTHMVDPNQLPTPDEETLPNIHFDHSLPSNDIENIPQNTPPSAQPQPQPRKRKARDSDKKSRKKRREESRLSEDNHGISEQASEAPEQVDEAAREGSVVLGDTTSPLPSTKSRIESAANDSTSRIGHLARAFYSQRYAGKNSTPTQSDIAALSQERSKAASLSPAAADNSPSAARLERQEGGSRSSSARLSPKREPIEEEDESIAEEMDVDEPNQKPADGAEDVGDISMPDQDGDTAEADADAGEDMEQLGSDDLGATSDAERPSPAQSPVPEDPSERQIPESPVREPASNPSTGKSKVLRQYGTKASTSKKRRAKDPYMIEDDDPEQDNVQAFAELPSPTAVAASRKRKGKNIAGPAEAGPSAKPRVTRKQPKITALMDGEATASSPVPERPSTTPGPATTFTRLLPKKVTRINNPETENEIRGPFTGNEIRNLTEAIEMWRKNHNLTDAQVKEMVQKNPQQAKTHEFWDYVHYACPNRKRQKIINQVRKTHHNFVARATWTQEQHDELAELYETHGKNYRLLGQLINRHPDDVRDRIRNYVVCGKNRRSDAWNHEEALQLLAIVEELFESIRERQKRDSSIRKLKEDELVDWTLVSEKMGHTRSRLQCRVKWKHLQLRKEGGNIDGEAGHSIEEIIQAARDDFKTMTHKDLFLVAKAVKKAGTLADSRIGWQKLRKRWYAMERWKRPALMLAWYRLRRAVPDWRIMSCPEIAKHHLDHYEQTKEIRVQAEDEMDLDAEYIEMEHKIRKIIRGAMVPKSSYYAIKSDDEESEPGEGGDLDAYDGPDDQHTEGSTFTSPKIGSEAPRNVDDIVSIPESPPTTKRKARQPLPEVDSTVEQTPSKARADDVSDVESETSVGTPKLPRAAKKGAKASVKGKAKPNTKAKGKTNAAEPTTKPARKSTKGSSSKMAKQPLSAEKVSVEDEVSSDTDADEVEDIPAVLPE